MDIDFCTLSDTGGREINEDSVRCSVRENAACFVLCDGLGGHGRGEVASALAADHIIDLFGKSDDLEHFEEIALNGAQKVLLDEQKRLHAPFELKTTAVLLLITGGTYRYAYIGDSRIYCFRKNKVLSRSLDHSVPQMLALAGEIKEKQIRKHPDRNRLLRVMGEEWDEPRFVVSEALPLKDGDAFLLCSDGFWEPIDEKQMCKALKRSSGAREWTDMMKEQIMKNISMSDADNFSAVSVIYGKSR